MAQYYKKIKGKNYDAALLAKAEELVSSQGDGRISIQDAKELFLLIKDANDYSDVEKRSIKYIRDNFKFTPEADQWLRSEVRKWAAKRSATATKNNVANKKEVIKKEEIKKETTDKPATNKKIATNDRPAPKKKSIAKQSTEQKKSIDLVETSIESSHSAKPYQGGNIVSQAETSLATKQAPPATKVKTQGQASAASAKDGKRWPLVILMALAFLALLALLLWLFWHLRQPATDVDTNIRQPNNQSEQRATKKQPVKPNANDLSSKPMDKSSQRKSTPSLAEEKTIDNAIEKTAADSERAALNNSSANQATLSDTSQTSAPPPPEKGEPAAIDTHPGSEEQKTAKATASSKASQPQNNTYTIVKGDSLKSISKKLYGKEEKWLQIYELNKDKIAHPDRIKTGVTLQLP